MLMLELFDQPLPFKWLKKEVDYWQGEFVVNGMVYRAEFAAADPDAEFWAMAFYAINKDGRSEYEVTGTGNSTAVFATIVKMMREFKNEHPNVKIAFSAKGRTRQRLYATMVKRFSRSAEIADIGNQQRYVI